jgi:hypothetical protein
MEIKIGNLYHVKHMGQQFKLLGVDHSLEDCPAVWLVTIDSETFPIYMTTRLDNLELEKTTLPLP